MILNRKVFFLYQRIGDKPVLFQILQKHINAYNSVIVVSFVIINTFVHIKAAAIDGNLIKMLFCFYTTSWMFHRRQQMEKLGINVIQSSFLKEKPDEMKKLKQVEQVVLVEQLGTTRFENLAWEVALCEDSGKKIAGVLFV